MQTTPLRKEVRARQGYRPLFFVFWGFLLWLAATLLFRLAGQWFLVPSDVALLAATYYGSLPLIALVTLPVYSLYRLDSESRVRAAVLIALPGMLMHMATPLLHDRLFPNLPPETGGPLASWVFWAYALILLSGFTRIGQTRQG
ncbi:MAG: DUF5367 family protein [Bacillota bacterium]